MSISLIEKGSIFQSTTPKQSNKFKGVRPTNQFSYPIKIPIIPDT
jgi:hypothetical protein